MTQYAYLQENLPESWNAKQKTDNKNSILIVKTIVMLLGLKLHQFVVSNDDMLGFASYM